MPWDGFACLRKAEVEVGVERVGWVVCEVLVREGLVVVGGGGFDCVAAGGAREGVG